MCVRATGGTEEGETRQVGAEARAASHRRVDLKELMQQRSKTRLTEAVDRFRANVSFSLSLSLSLAHSHSLSLSLSLARALSLSLPAPSGLLPPVHPAPAAILPCWHCACVCVCQGRKVRHQCHIM